LQLAIACQSRNPQPGCWGFYFRLRSGDKPRFERLIDLRTDILRGNGFGDRRRRVETSATRRTPRRNLPKRRCRD
jgi:hypothetical protein